MNYELIDSTLERWSLDRGLSLQSFYKGYDVRSFEVFNDEGDKFQIWVDPPSEGCVDVHVWDYNRRRKDWSVLINDLYQTLDLAFCRISKWE